MANQIETGNTELYGKPASVLDVLLMGKYGNKTINPLAREFASNIGVVNDITGLANLTLVYYKDKWDKQYEALTLEYDALKPYNIELDESVDNSESVDSSSTSENIENESKNIDKIVETESVDEVNRNVTESKSGTDIASVDTTDTNVVDANTVNSTEKSHENDEVTKETEYQNLKDTLTKTGSEATTRTGEFSVDGGSDSTNDRSIVNNDLEKINNEHFGVEHTVTGDSVENENTSTVSNRNDNYIAPYVPVGSVQNNQSAEASSTNSNNGSSERSLELERSTDYSLQDISDATHSENSQLTQYKDVADTTTFNNRKDENERTGKVVETITTDGSILESGTTDNNGTSVNIVDSVNTQTYGSEVNSDETGSASNVKNETNIENITGNTISNGSEQSTVAKEGSSTKDSSEVGNKWNFTNQGLINEELELRKNNFYEMMLRDVASLITLSVYA